MAEPRPEAAASPPMLVVAAALTAADGRVLVQRRPASKAQGGLWEFPGGKVEAGEGATAALARELAEELGLTVEEAAMVPVTFAATERLVLLLFRVRRWTGTPVATAADAVAWVAPADLSRWAMPPLDRPLAAALARG